MTNTRGKEDRTPQENESAAGTKIQISDNPITIRIWWKKENNDWEDTRKEGQYEKEASRPKTNDRLGWPLQWKMNDRNRANKPDEAVDMIAQK